MTTLHQDQKTCGVCGAKSTHTVMGSSNTMGAADLDLRPPPMLRDTLPLQMQECPKCGYCVADIGRARDGVKELVCSAAYAKVLKDPGRPALCNRFLAASFLAEKSGVRESAGHLAVRAAWAADDAGAADVARACRLHAVSLLDGVAGDEPGHTEALLVDLLRRAGELERARVMCDRGLGVTSDPAVQKVLELQAKLITSADTAVHRLDEALP
jgi:hypothetical protein